MQTTILTRRTALAGAAALLLDLAARRCAS